MDIPPEKFKKEIVIGEKLLTSEQYRELQKNIYETRELGFLMEPVPGISQFLSFLSSEEHTVRVVTSRSGVGLEIAEEWSMRQGFQLDFTGVGYGVSKADVAAGLDIYVDDDLDKLKPLVGIVPNLFLFSWGYNLHIDAGSIAQRLDSWETMHKTIQQLTGLR